jgi:hypothetical protein
MTLRKCLLFYPWNLEERIGSFLVFCSYAQVLNKLGFQLDCFAPVQDFAALNRRSPPFDLFNNIFTPPEAQPAVFNMLNLLGHAQFDALLPDLHGRDDASMAAAGVLASIGHYDLVGIHYTRCHSVRALLPESCKTLLFTHELDSVVAKQEETILGVPVSYTIHDEVERLRPFDLVTVLGPDDFRRLNKHAPDINVVEAPFSVPVSWKGAATGEMNRILLWISSAGVFHSLSFAWFWRNVWPLVRKKNSNCRLIIAGRICEVALDMGASQDPQVSLMGVVKDAEALYAKADLLVAAYLYGDGIKTKVIEALARGLPVVTTPPGLSNTRILPGREALVADEARNFADHILELLEDRKKCQCLAEAGVEYITKWHNPETAFSGLSAAIDRIMGKQSLKIPAKPIRQIHVHEHLRSLTPWVVSRCIDNGARKVAFYGAGSHTQMLLPIWRACSGPTVVAIVVTGKPTVNTLHGLPVISSDDFDPKSVDAVIASSQGYETEIAEYCKQRWPALPVYTIWRPAGMYGWLGIGEEKIPSIPEL